jgi:hypothetical protein
MRQAIPSRAWNASIILAIAVFVGISIYPILWPIHHYHLECPEMVDGGKVLPSEDFEIERNQLAGFTAWAKARKCTVTPAGRQFLLAGRIARLNLN